MPLPTVGFRSLALNRQVVTLGSYITLAAAGLVAGTYQAGAEVLPLGDQVIAECTGCHWLIDPSDPNYFTDGYNLGLTFLNSVWYTSSADLSADSDAITRFFQVEKKALAIVKTMQPDAVAQAVQASGVPGWQAMTLGEVEAAVTGLGVEPNNAWQDAVDFNHISLGAVPQQLWAQTLQAIALQGQGVNVSDPAYSYANVINTSVMHSVFGFNTTKYVSINSSGSYSSTHLTARAGTFTLMLKNDSEVAHGVKLVQKGHGVVGSAAPVTTGNYAQLTLNLPVGTYYYEETNSNSAVSGLKGTLVVYKG